MANEPRPDTGTEDIELDSMSQEDIPDLIEAVLPIWRREIRRIQRLRAPTAQDISTSIRLQQALSQAYYQYRVLKAQIRAELRQVPRAELVQMIGEYVQVSPVLGPAQTGDPGEAPAPGKGEAPGSATGAGSAPAPNPVRMAAEQAIEDARQRQARAEARAAKAAKQQTTQRDE